MGLALVTTVIGTLLAVTVSAPPAAAGPPPVMTGYIPLPADEFQGVMENVNTAADPTVDFTAGITNAGDGSIMYYDHWEDGFEADIANPVQATTEVWGDGNAANGNAAAATRCGVRCAGDLLTPGDVFVMRNNISTPRSAATILFDGRDKVASTRGFTITAGGFSTPLGSVLAGSVSAYDTSKYGTEYVAPVGQDTPTPSGTSPAFETSSLVIMASADDTVVQVDANADGTFETTDTIDEGEVVFVDGGVLEGARVVSDKPVQVHEGTGDVGSNYESRWYTLFPTPTLSSDYLNPVASNVDNFRTIIYLYNPNDADITVTPTCTSCSGTLTVPANSSLSFPNPLNQAVRFQSSGGETFVAIGGVGAQSGAAPGPSGDNSTSWDWGFTLVPTGLLTTQAVLGWAPGNSNNPPSAPSGNRDDNPVWVTTLTATTLRVDFDGDPSTGAIASSDCFGARHDQELVVSALAVTRIHDSVDGDMTGARLYTCDGTKVAGAWGEDPQNAPTGSPGFDAGYALIPTTTMIVDKSAAVYTDSNGDGGFSPGDVIEYDISIADAGNLAFTSVNAQDVMPAGTAYVPSSTVFDDGTNETPIADDATPPAATAFPLDETGASLPDIDAGDTVHLRFRAVIEDPFQAQGTVLLNEACADAIEVNVAESAVDACDTVASQLTESDLSLAKMETASPTYVGDEAVFEVVVTNDGPDTATGVEVTDLLPAGTTFVGSSATQGSYDHVTGLWSVGTLATGASATLEVTATIDVLTVENVAQVTAANAADPDSQPDENPLGGVTPPDQDDEDSVTVTVSPLADLELDKELTSGPDAAGNATFLVTLTNGGPSIAVGTVVADVPPAGSSFVDATTSTGTFDSTTNQWTVPTLAVGASATLSITYDIGTFPSENYAQVVVTSAPDPDSQPAEGPLGPGNPPDQDDEDSAAIPTLVDLSLTKVETSSPTYAGDTASYVVAVANAGPGTATGVEVTDLLPSGLTLVTATPSVGTYAPGSGVWSVGSLASGASATLTLSARVVQPGTLTNTAQVTAADEPDIDSTPANDDPDEDDQASVSITTTGAAVGDRVWFDVDGDGVQDAGEPGLSGVAVDVVWAGVDGTPGTIDDVTSSTTTGADGAWSVADLPSGPYRVAVDPSTLPYGIVAPTYDLDGTGTPDAAAFTLSGGATRDDVDFGYRGASVIGDTVFVDTDGDDLADPGEGAPNVDVTVTWFGPDGSTGGGDDVTYTDTTDADGLYSVVGLPAGSFRVVVDTTDLPAGVLPSYDPDGGTDSTSLVTLPTSATDDAQDFGYLIPAVDLWVTKTDGDAAATAGGGVSYTIDYGNRASATVGATGVVLTETVPANSTFDPSASSAGWSCVAGTCTFAVGTLAPGASGTAAFSVIVASPLAAGVDELSNTISITDDGASGDDTDPDDNTDVETTPIVAAPDLVVTKSDGDVTVGPADVVAYTISYANNGSIGATGVVLTETVPASTTFVPAASTAGWTCVAATCAYDVGSLAVGASGSVTFAVRVDLPLPDGTTGIDNTVSIADDGDNGDDANSSDNSDDEGTPVLTGTVGDLVFLDGDGDGVADPGEGLAGADVTVTWAGPNGTFGDGDDVTFPTSTDASGLWVVDGLPTGAMRVSVVPPLTGVANTVDPDGANDSTSTLVLGLGETDLDQDFAYRGTASVGDRAWDDADADGIQDAGESGLAGVTVALLDGSGATIATTVTGASGDYSFANLLEGEYEIVFSAPAGWRFAPNDAGSDLVDSDAAPVSGRTGIFALGAGAADTTRDAGLYQPGSIGDTVFSDTDGDGVQDPGEPGLGGVLVALLRDADGDGTFETTVGAVPTSGSGTYTFVDLPPGSYRVVVTPPSGQTATTPTTVDVPLAEGADRDDVDFGFRPPAPPPPGTIGDRVWNDVDADGVQDPGEAGVNGVLVTLRLDLDSDGSFETVAATQTTAGDGDYGFGNLPPGTYLVVVDVPAGSFATTVAATTVALVSGESVLDADFGLRATEPPAGSIGDRVWDDTDGDGVQDPGESGVDGVTVTLLEDTDGDGVYDSTVATDTTAGDGTYGFTDLPPGSYRVVVTPPAGTTPTTSPIVDVALGAGDTVVDADVGLGGAQVALGAIGDRVWSDSDQDGVQDTGEAGINGVTVTLLRDVDGDGVYETTVSTTTTAGDGDYLFDDLAPGRYLVVVAPPAGMAPTGPGSIPVTLAADELVDDADVGLATPAAIPYDLELIKDLLGELESGAEASWRLTVRNNGIATASAPITVTDVLPAGLTFVRSEGAGWQCAVDGTIVTCVLDADLAIGDEVTVDVATLVESEPGTVLENDATVSGDGPEVTLLNNSDDASGVVVDDPEPPTTTTTTPPSSTPSTTTATGDPGTTASTGPLPATGSSTGLLTAIGAALLGLGLLLVALRRRLEGS